MVLSVSSSAPKIARLDCLKLPALRGMEALSQTGPFPGSTPTQHLERGVKALPHTRSSGSGKLVRWTTWREKGRSTDLPTGR